MVPNFALSLSFESIALLHRLGDGWVTLGETRPDVADLDAAMARLLELRLKTAPGGGRVAIVLPNEQIKYITVPDPGMPNEQRMQAVTNALDGATPYDIQDLIIDWSLGAGSLLAAAIARETLIEAEEFTQQYGFTPVNHTACAPDGFFEGAVHFGASTSWTGRPPKRFTQAIVMLPNDPILAPESPTPKTTKESSGLQKSDVQEDLASKSEAVVQEGPDQIKLPEPTVPETQVNKIWVAAQDAPPAASTVQPVGQTSSAQDETAIGPIESQVSSKTVPQSEGADVDETGEFADSSQTKPLVFSSDRAARKALNPKLEEKRNGESSASASQEDPLPSDKVTPKPGDLDEPDLFSFSESSELETPVDTADLPTQSTPSSKNLEDLEPTLNAPQNVDEQDVVPKESIPATKDERAAHLSASRVPERGEESAFASLRAHRDDTSITGSSAPIISAPTARLGESDNPDNHTSDTPRLRTHPKALQTALISSAPAVQSEPKRSSVSTRQVKPVRSPDDDIRHAHIGSPKLEGDDADDDTSPEVDASKGSRKRRSIGKFLRRKESASDNQSKIAPSASDVAHTSVDTVQDPTGDLDAHSSNVTPLARDVADHLEAKPSRALRSLSSSKKLQPAATAKDRKTTPRSPLSENLSAAGSSASRTISAKDEERLRLTVFGARTPPKKTGGKPRFLGITLVLALVLIMAGVFASASFFQDTSLAKFFRSSITIDVATQGPAQPDAAATEKASSIIGALPNVLGKAGPSEDIQIASLDVPDFPQPDDQIGRTEPDFVLTLPSTMTQAEAASTYLATGIWQRSPNMPVQPFQSPVGDVYPVALDPNVQESDPIALPSLNRLAVEPILRAPRLPPAAGAIFLFDDRGLVRATPEGALTPDGIRIFAGQPPVIPPRRDDTGLSAARPEARAPAVEGAEPSASQQTKIAQGPQIRPRTRPSDLTERKQRAALGGSTLAELSAFRPVVRPQSAQQIAEQEAEVENPDPTPSRLATAQSLEPRKRPNDLQRRAASATATQTPDTSSNAATTRVASAVAVPRRNIVAPTAPSSATVAKQATVRNAINLNKVNLIGVSGSPSARRAMVRLPNARYQKVKVGDRLDGGRVTAIGDSELRYVKGGRNVLLKMPRG